ncbi:hypothetical protein [Celeribacter baekdonensis]|uniref:Uncharacterized protein n=1 Tax=Celeribacter baekdonensis TaxID=875171 RepID=A0A2R4M700_9RHOB|nr:hypothetical protein [Celeribacter baekdonensis]AVW92991.1 hypothetical protein DA792_19455 [Celeribacter baekdonensis]
MRSRFLRVKCKVNCILGRYSIPLRDIDPRLLGVGNVQLNHMLRQHIHSVSFEMFLLRLSRHTAYITDEKTPKLRVQPAAYFAEAMLYFIVGWTCAAIMVKVEGGLWSDSFLMLACSCLMAITYVCIFIFASKKLLKNCETFLKFKASEL